ncbi:adenosine receptor A3-like [Oculina patagonica]
MAENFTRTEIILWTIAFSVESLAIIVGNAVTIAVFWKQKSTLKRTRYLLINLSVADLMVGVGVIEDTACLSLKNEACKISQETNLADATFGIASLSFLVLIALERLYAIVCPLRHRTTKTSTYFYFIAASWAVSTILIITTYPIFDHFKVKILFQSVVSSTFTATCLIIICVAYLTILIYSKKEDPRLSANCRQHSKKLAKTLFIVTLLSVITWLPHGITNILRFITDKEEGNVYMVGHFFRLANSLVNPIVYCYRMPEFRKTLRKLFVQWKRNNRETQAQLSQLELTSWNQDPPVLLSFSHLNA